LNSERVNTKFVSVDRTTNQKTFTAIAALEFSGRPVAGDRLALSLGPVGNEHVLSEGSFKWETTEFGPSSLQNGKLPWAVAYSEVLYEATRPHWLTITEAQLLEGRDGVSLLRATVSNPTEEARPLLSMTFSTSRYPSFFACDIGDPIQTVVLRWEKQDSPEQITAETSLSGVEIPVQIKYNFGSRCNGYNIRALIPLSESIPANVTKIVSVRMKELPVPPANLKSQIGADTILSWPSKWISLFSDQGVIKLNLSFSVLYQTLSKATLNKFSGTRS
jgi:hypothetical protein